MRLLRNILLALVGLFGLCTLPSVLRSRTVNRQRRTMADMRSIATAWEARAADIQSYSVAARDGAAITPADLARALEPKYIRHLPRKDEWGSEFRFATNDYDSEGRAATYVIRSFGSDRQPDRLANAATGATRDPADDIIFSNGSFIRFPEASG